MCKISVITPFYKGNQYMDGLFSVIGNNLRYLQQNNMKDVAVELIIVNDSPDTMVEVPSDTRNVCYKVINHEVNGGIHQARVTGLKHSEGEYVLFLDQDDKILDEFIYKQLSQLGDKNVIVANALLEQSDGSSRKLYNTKYDLNLVNCFDAYLKSRNQITSPGQAIIKRDAIPEVWTKWIMKTNGSDDLFLWILLLKNKNLFVLNPECLYIHKYTGENLSSSEEKMSHSSLEVATYLEKIEGSCSEDIMKLIRSREFGFSWKASSGIKRLKLVLSNVDILFSRCVWKINRILRNKLRIGLL